MRKKSQKWKKYLFEKISSDIFEKYIFPYFYVPVPYIPHVIPVDS
jgi:hypothetical protein